MKNLLITLCLFFGAIVAAMGQTDYLQWEVMHITPKDGQSEMLKKGLAAHHKAYHASDPYKVWVGEVLTGPNSGDYAWIMGPTTWTQMDNRPASDAHDADWAKNVGPYTERVGEVSYWRSDKDIVYSPENAGNFPKSRLRFNTLLPGEGDRFKDQLNKIIAVYKAKKYGAAYNVYWRYGASQGPHVVTELNFANWAYLDNGVEFSKDFEEVNGDGSWDRFLEEMALSIDRSKTYDVLMNFMPEASSSQ